MQRNVHRHSRFDTVIQMASAQLKIRTSDGQLLTVQAESVEVVHAVDRPPLQLSFTEDGKVEGSVEDGLLTHGPGCGNMSEIETCALQGGPLGEPERSSPYAVSAVVNGEKRPLALGDATQLVVEVAPDVEVGICIAPHPGFRGHLVLEIPPFDVAPTPEDHGLGFKVMWGGANVLHAIVSRPGK